MLDVDAIAKLFEDAARCAEDRALHQEKLAALRQREAESKGR